MSYIPIEYNNYTYVKLKEIIYPYVVLDSCENFGLSDLVKFSTCKNRNFLMPFMVHMVCISSYSFRFNHMCLLFTILPVAGTSGKFKMESKMTTNNKNGPLN